MKKVELRRAVVLVIAVILLVVIIKCVQGCDSTKKALKEKGYNEDEINVIVEKLDEETITKILEIEYNDKSVSFFVYSRYLNKLSGI